MSIKYLSGSILVLLVCLSQPALADQIVSAHRGGAAYAPENTLPAFSNAIRLGVDDIETDAQFSADGELILLHDDTLDRTTNCSGAVKDWTHAELTRQCDAAWWFAPGQPTTRPDETLEHPMRGKGIVIPTVRALLELVQNKAPRNTTVTIEIKDIPGEANFEPLGLDIAEALVALIQQMGMRERVIVQSFWPTPIENVKRLDPGIRTLFLSTTETGVGAIANVGYTTARGHDVAAPNFDAPDLTATLVALAQAAGKQVIPWTVDTPQDIEKVLGLGVDGLMSNFPACALSSLGRQVPERVIAPGMGNNAHTDACPAR